MDGSADSEFIDDSSQILSTPFLVTLLVLLLSIVVIWFFKRRPQSRRGECLLLCGVSNSGKTLLFCRLTMGLAKRTITSMAVNTGSMFVNLSSDRPTKKVHVIDVPGNLRIRQRDFNANKHSAKAIIFVIDSTTIRQESKDVSDYLFDILSEKSFRQQRLPLLIFCNKQDINNDNESIESIRTLLETELTVKRRTRTSTVDVHQGKTELTQDIGQKGKENFEFADIKDIRVKFIDGSALGTEKKSFADHYDDEEEDEENIDSAGDETDADNGPNLDGLMDWIGEIWK